MKKKIPVVHFKSRLQFYIKKFRLRLLKCDIYILHSLISVYRIKFNTFVKVSTTF